MNEITPWVSEKMLEEYKIEHRPPDEKQMKISLKLRNNSNYNNKTILCSNCNKMTPQHGSRGNLYECKCQKQRTRTASLQSFSQDVLLKSALSAAVLQDGYDPVSGWYDDDVTMKSDIEDTKSRLTHMKEISRSESCLFPDTGHFTNEGKENKSDNDALDYNNVDDKSLVLTDDDEFSLHNLVLVRSSDNVQRRKCHRRSKSDQVGVSQIDFVDGKKEKNFSQLTSSSLPKELLTQGKHIISIS